MDLRLIFPENASNPIVETFEFGSKDNSCKLTQFRAKDEGIVLRFLDILIEIN